MSRVAALATLPSAPRPATRPPAREDAAFDAELGRVTDQPPAGRGQPKEPPGSAEASRATARPGQDTLGKTTAARSDPAEADAAEPGKDDAGKDNAGQQIIAAAANPEPAALPSVLHPPGQPTPTPAGTANPSATAAAAAIEATAGKPAAAGEATGKAAGVAALLSPTIEAGKTAGPAEPPGAKPAAAPSAPAQPAPAAIPPETVVQPLPAAGAPDPLSAPAAPEAAPAAASRPAVPLDALPVSIAAEAQAGARRFTIRLDPAELGEVQIRLDIGEDGVPRAHLIVERPSTLQHLMQDAPKLEQALAAATGNSNADAGVTFSLRDGAHRQGAEAHAGAQENTENAAARTAQASLPAAWTLPRSIHHATSRLDLIL